MKLSIKFTIIVLLCTAFAKAQVGIGTNDPKAALDIRATANPEESGILIPKLSDFPPGVTVDQDGMLIYIDGSGATTKGFYYYEHNTTTWIPIAGAAAADNQQIDVLNLNGTNLEISLQDDGIATQTLDLSPLQDGTGTDNQTIDNFNFNSGTGILTLELEDDGVAPQTVNLSSLAGSGGTDDQQIDVLNLNGTNLEISLEDDGVVTQTLDLSPMQDGTGTDNQTIDNFNLNTSTGILTLEIEDDGIAPQNVDISTITGFGGTDNQQIDVLNLNGTDLEISLQDDGIAIQTLDLSSLQDGTGTDNQTIDNFNFNTGTGILTLELEDDGQTPQTVNLNSLSGDSDWIRIGTTSTPATTVVQNMFHSGNVSIGSTNTTINGNNSKLLVSSNDVITSGIHNYGAETALAINLSGTSNSSAISAAIDINNSASGTRNKVNINNEFTGSDGSMTAMINDFSTGSDYTIENGIINNLNGNLFGSGASSTGEKTGVRNNIIGVQDGDKTGLYNVFGSSTPGAVLTNGILYGVKNIFTSRTGSFNKYGSYTQIDQTANGTHYGTYNDVQKANSYAAYFIGRTSLGNSTTNRYLMPANDGTVGQVMTTDGSGNVFFQTPTTFTDTDNQQIDILNLNGTNLEISLQDDGIATQTLDLSPLTGGGTLDQAYDFSGAGNGNTIIATDGAVTIAGEDGLLVSGTFGTGDAINTSGAGTRMFFNPRKAAFRAGNVGATQWDDTNVGSYSTAFGSSSTASGSQSFALSGGTASGTQSFATGLFAQASGNASVAFRGGNASGLGSFAMGSSAQAIGNFSHSFGINTRAEQDVSIAMGYDVVAPSIGEMAVGLYNTDYTPSASSGGFSTSDRVFSVGNGWNGVRSNALSIYKNGRMNINDEYNMPLTDGTAGQVMTTDGAGNVVFQNVGGSAANNGLTLTAGVIRLGGALTQNTVITQATRSLDFNLNSTGDFAIQDNGTDVFFVEDSGDIGIGTSNPEHPFHIIETNIAEREGLFIDKNDNTTAESNGIYVEKSGSGTGRSHAIRTRNDGTGTGQKYGVFNTITSTSTGNQYGTRNFLSGATAAWQFGTFNNMDNAGTGNRYGVYNGMRNANATNLYGVYNEFERNYNSADDIVGVRNRFTAGTPGTTGMNGVWTDFTTAANGNYYGTRTEYSTGTTGTGNKYGNYNIISASAGGTHYGIYNSVGVNNGWASYNLGKSYISERLSIGETDNADGRVAILNNSGGTLPAHIQLTETTVNDGPRIQFANAVETTNEWTLFGRADDTFADSSFNFFYTTTGNIMEIKGDGDVEINGQLGVNVNNPNYAIQLPNNTANGTGRGQANAWVTYSDQRIKSNLSDLDNGTDLIMKMNPQRYFQHDSSFKNSELSLEKSGTFTLGFLAQELYEILPEAVQKPDNQNEELWSVNYNKVIPVAVKAIQEQQQTIEVLQDKIRVLEAENNRLKELEKRIEVLEKK